MERIMMMITSQSLKQILAAVVFAILVAGCGSKEQEAASEHGDHDEEPGTTVSLTMERVRHAGITIRTVDRRSLPIPLELSGKVEFNERKLAHVTSRIEGRIEKVFAVTNDAVTEGSTLMEVFSSEFLTVQYEFIQACERRDRAVGASESDRSAASDLVESARRKLLVLGVNEADIRELELTRTPKNAFAVRSPLTGIVITSAVRLGEAVQRGSDLLELADLRSPWVLADLYEKDLPYVRKGMPATVHLDAVQSSWEASVSAVYSVVDERTRTVKARLEVENAGETLKPGMYCTVRIQTQLGASTVKVPSSALLGETEKHFVFVALNDTTFERRDVRTGMETSEYAEVLDGLLEGERIVVAGGFFLKSELAKETFGEEH